MFGIYEQIATMLDPVLPVNEKRLKRQVKDVFPIHLYLLEFAESLPPATPVKELCSKPSGIWIKKTVAKIYGKWQCETVKPSNRTLKVAECELKGSILGDREFKPNDYLKRQLSAESIKRLRQKADSTRLKIKNHTFKPKKYVQPRGWSRLHSAIPQPQFKLCSIPIDSLALYQLLIGCGFNLGQDASRHFMEEKEEAWRRIFNINELQGVNFAGKTFDLFCTTNGVKSSFLCSRPSRTRTAKEPLTITENNRVWGCDPGIRSLVVMNNSSSKFDSSAPTFNVDFSSNQYHHHAFHYHAINNRRRRLKNNPEIQQYEKGITVHLTSRYNIFREHLQSALGVYRHLIRFNSQNRTDAWTTFRCRQRTLDCFANHIHMLTPEVNKKDIILAYGSASFSHTMRGHQSVPTKLLPKTLARHMTVIPVDEYHTSQQCSRYCTGTFKKLQNVYDDESDYPIWGVKYCPDCDVYWNRDTNAARNILHRFLFENQFGYIDPIFQRTSS